MSPNQIIMIIIGILVLAMVICVVMLGLGRMFSVRIEYPPTEQELMMINLEKNKQFYTDITKLLLG